MNNYYDFLLIYYMKYGLLLQGQIFQEQGVINYFTFFLALTKYAHEILGFFSKSVTEYIWAFTIYIHVV